MRTSTKTVAFDRPFVIGGFDELLPAGAYNVETDEELLEGVSFPVYRRTSTRIHLNPKPGRRQILTIDSKELDAAVKRDRASAEMTAARATCQKITPKGTTESSQEDADNLAMARGEDEGMLVHPGETHTSRRQQDIASQNSRPAGMLVRLSERLRNLTRASDHDG